MTTKSMKPGTDYTEYKGSKTSNISFVQANRGEGFLKQCKDEFYTLANYTSIQTKQNIQR